MKSISIIGATFDGNRGAEAMLSTTIAKLKAEYLDDAVLFNVFSYYPARDKQIIDDSMIEVYSATPMYLVLVLLPCSVLYKTLQLLHLTFLHRFLPSSVQALASSKALICLAGVSFIDGREKFLPFNIATILPAIILKVPVVKFAQAMGPFKSWVNRLAGKIFLGQCQQIFTRGEKTQSHLRDLFGKRDIYQRADDVAFLFESDFCLSKSGQDFDLKLKELDSLRHSGKKIIGVCPSIVVAKQSEKSGGDYRRCMHELITDLVTKGYCVALYPNATRGKDMDKTHNNDLPLLETILAGLNNKTKESVVGFTGSVNAKQIHKIINNCDVHSVSRFHAMIAALAASIPVMVVGWSHKYLEVMERFGQQDMVLGYEEGRVEPIINCIERLEKEGEMRSRQILTALSDVKQMSSLQIEYVIGMLEK